MRKVTLIIAVLALGIALQGCYTVLAKKKLSRRTWSKYHNWEFFHDSNWGKEWNTYYYDPYLGKRPRKKKTSNKNIHEHEISTVASSSHHSHRHKYTDCQITSCLFTGYLPEEEQEEREHSESQDSTETLPPEKPKEKRGL